ncbi:GAF domain-containing protein [Pseudemcibacter aquimaris]|uniref:GAF domain-containing protein n=1 Tax=Pseudemcibacter aquimaris TaxID=2857064 RepID=UPI0020132A2A|nr:GAF domain-containing protein [Pseudemcibacter aquimaris]MCC3860157.1 GAF domain-containing protein [Pseudemcibacter aquimaris]WDU57484.1 GAF domain-containing protein [Pseudemcibacter aquimaris]
MENIKKLILESDGPLPEKDILSALAQDVLDQLDVDLVSIWYFDDGLSKITCQHSVDKFKKRELKDTVLLAADFPNYFTAMIEGVTIRADDVTSDRNTIELVDAYFNPNDIKSLLDYIIYTNGKPTGLICCETTSTYRHWQDSDETIIRALTVMAGMELRNASSN